MRMVVTGGRGFIGSHFVELALCRGHHIIDIDIETYCANQRLPFDSNPRYKHTKADIVTLDHLPPCDVVINFAAETHVDNSITYSEKFVYTNINGVHKLLELIRHKVYERPAFVQISTDEVYGDRRTGEFFEFDSLTPSNPYSATKAAAEHLVTSYARTYGLNYLITRSSNNYGPRQYDEKLIAKIISCIKENRKIPIHGDGSYVRDWIYVKDNALAILDLVEKGVSNDIYNIAGGLLLSNLQVVEQVALWHGVSDWKSCIVHTENRLGQDLRYSISCDKIRSAGIQLPNRSKLYNFLGDIT